MLSMTDEYIESCISDINEMLEDIKRSGKSVKAKGKYLVLEDILEVELSDKIVE